MQATIQTTAGIGRTASTSHVGRFEKWFLLLWFVLNLLQIAFTELTSDEGYYWFYSQHLQWGYYDHPPMLAAMIKAGTAFLPGEMGVRFFNVVLSTAGLWLFLGLLPDAYKNNRRTYLVLLAAPLLHYLTFLIFPDGPLLFFSLLFLVLYKRFLERPTIVLSLLMGIALALMAYSKYHGALVLLFAVLANPKLLKSGYFYLMLLMAAVLFAPHIWWQYDNGFPTFKYHLSGRTGSWSFKHVGEYLSQQVVAIGPAFVFVPFVFKAKDVFERTLKVIVIGTFAFFLFSSFKTFVHFHWTSIALYPLLYFAVGYYQNPQRRKLFHWLAMPFVLLLAVARILLAVPLIDNLHAGEDYYQGRKTWAQQVAILAGDKPVFMPNNLREVPLYSFYSGKQGVTLYDRPEKKSQYDLWGYEDSLQGKAVFFLTRDDHPGSVKTVLLGREANYSIIPSFQSFYNSISIDAMVAKATADTVYTTLTLTNKTAKPVSFEKREGNDYIGLVYIIRQGKSVRKSDAVLALATSDNLGIGESITKQVSVPIANLPQGDYKIAFGIRSGPLSDAILSDEIFIKRK